MKRFTVIILAILLLFSSSCRQKADVPATSASKIYTYLVAGLDEAASNTDVLFLVSYSQLEEEATVLQIPRDTFSRYENTEGKINRIVPTLLARGMARDEAMSELRRYVEDGFGIEIDGYVSFDTEGFRQVVDAVGGVDITSDRDIVIFDEHGEEQFTVKRGTTHLNGKMAETFVRFRRGYATGDLGRIDAQKLFIDAFLRSVKAMGIDEAARLAVALVTEVRTDLKPYDVLRLITENKKALGNLNVKYATLPGEATVVDGASFYVLNRKNAAEILSERFGAKEKEFDTDKIFTSSDKPSIKNIYYDEDSRYKFYKD